MSPHCFSFRGIVSEHRDVVVFFSFCSEYSFAELFLLCLKTTYDVLRFTVRGSPYFFYTVQIQVLRTDFGIVLNTNIPKQGSFVNTE